MSGAIYQSIAQSMISAHRRTSLSIFHIVRRFVGILTKTAILYNRNSDSKTHKGRVPWQGLLTKSVKGHARKDPKYVNSMVNQMFIYALHMYINRLGQNIETF